MSDYVVFNGTNETDYSTAASENPYGHNKWTSKTVRTLRDQTTQEITYKNYLGQTLLTDLYDPGTPSHTVTYNRYDDEGRLILAAEPSAVITYDDQQDDLGVSLETDSGLIRRSFYYPSTTASGGTGVGDEGGAKGYLWYEQLWNGTDDEHPDTTASYKYYAHTGMTGDYSTTVYPLAEVTVYSNEDSTTATTEGAATTEYAYTWQENASQQETVQIEEMTVTLPAVSGSHNGPGTSATTSHWYDSQGNPTWSIDELGRVTYSEYDSVSGLLTQTIDDVNSSQSAGLSPPNGYAGNADGLHLTTDYTHDEKGRVTQVLGPLHRMDGSAIRTGSWTFYDDVAHETRYVQGYVQIESENIVGANVVSPVSITKTDHDGRTLEAIEVAYSNDFDDLEDLVNGLEAAPLPQTDYTAWTTYQYDDSRLLSTRVYDDIPSSGEGTLGTEYEQTTYGYEDLDEAGTKARRNRVQVGPDGNDSTITRTVYDARGNVVETWIGTNDDAATDSDPTGGGTDPDNNMVLVSSSVYDENGNVTDAYSHYDSGANDRYTTEFEYDWRNRLTGELSPADVVTHYEYDNLGRTLWTKTYASADFTLASSELRGQTQNLYDDLGRIYESRVYQVNQQDWNPGGIGSYLPTSTWYDAAGQVIKTATGKLGSGSTLEGYGLTQKYTYDGVGRVVMSYVCFDVDELNYADADDVTGDTVMEQYQTWYDAAGQAVATATYQRFPDDTSTTGALDATNSYATASATWYDGLGRVVAAAGYGREDDTSGVAHYFFSSGAIIDNANNNGIPDVADAQPPDPDSSDNYIVTHTEYDEAGRAYLSTDNVDRKTRTFFDDAGRTLRTVVNYVDGTVSETDLDADLTTLYEYDSAGRLVTVTTRNAKGSGKGIDDQATKYLYNSDFNAAWQTGVVYPDTTDELQQNGTTKVWTFTTDNGDHVSTTYDRLGRLHTTTDQRGVVHTFSYDTAGRLSADTATSLGGSGIVDASIRRIGTTYDDVGRVRFVTSYSDTAGNTALNQVKYEYDGWGNVETEYQEHDGLVNEASDGSLKIAYTYGAGGSYEEPAGTSVARYVRLMNVAYPRLTPGDPPLGRSVNYLYTGSTINDMMSRPTSIATNGAHATFTYLGAGQVVSEDYTDVDIRLDYYKLDYQLDDTFTAWDRFGRVVDQIWTDYGEEEVIDHFRYGYDRAGNRVWKENIVSGQLQTPIHLDELYTYDALNRLLSATRGNLVDGANGKEIQNENFGQNWGLDGLGNFGSFTESTVGGTVTLAQTRDTNSANEFDKNNDHGDDTEDSISSTVGDNWVDPVYDAAGNMISAPKPGAGTTRVHYIYDAWNRLVAQKADSGGSPGSVIAQFQYDGLNRRVEKSDQYDWEHHYYYNTDWQILEDRELNTASQKENVDQYIWSPRHVDSPIVCLHDGDGGGVGDNQADGDVGEGYPGDWRRYYLTDANHNVTTSIRHDNSNDPANDGVTRYVYTPYGEVTETGDNWTGTSSEVNFDGPRYAGYFFDTETGLYQVRNRYYDPNLSNFISRDPIGYDAGDPNLYRYVANGPLGATDPWGLSKIRLIYKIGEQVVKVRDLPEALAKRILHTKTRSAGNQGVRIFIQAPEEGGRNVAKKLAREASPVKKSVWHRMDRHGHPAHYHPVTGHSKEGAPITRRTPHIGKDYTGSAGVIVIVGVNDQVREIAGEVVDIVIELTPIGDVRTIVIEGPQLISVTDETLDIITAEAVRGAEIERERRSAGIRRFADPRKRSESSQDKPLQAGSWRAYGFGF